MSGEEGKPVDHWEEKLNESLEELQACQVSKEQTTCSTCKEFFECVIRKSYVKSVYESMNKGSGGGFEF